MSVIVNHDESGNVETSLDGSGDDPPQDNYLVAVSQEEHQYDEDSSPNDDQDSNIRDDDGLCPYQADENNDRSSVKSRNIKCILHVDYYLVKFRKFTDYTILTIPLEDINDNMYRGFVRYLGKDARRYCNPQNERLSHQTSDNYLSGIKCIIVERASQENKAIPLVCGDKNTSKYRTLLHGMYLEDSIKTGKNMSDPPYCSYQTR